MTDDHSVSFVLVVGHDTLGPGEAVALACDLPRIGRSREIIIVNRAMGGAGLYAELSERLSELRILDLAGGVDRDTAIVAGMENAINDVIVVVSGSVGPAMIKACSDAIVCGHDVACWPAETASRHGDYLYRIAKNVFRAMSRRLAGYDPVMTSGVMAFARPAAVYVLQHEHVSALLAEIIVRSAFNRVLFDDEGTGRTEDAPCERESRLGRGIAMLLGASRVPMRLATALSLGLGAANLLYALYVVIVNLVRDDVAEGWTTVSLQIAGGFFVVSLVLALVAEYVLVMAEQSQGRPRYFIKKEHRGTFESRDCIRSVERE